MFSQVVATLLRLTVAHADHWLDVRGSHAVPTYGFERYADPPPLDVDVTRLLTAFANGRVSVGDAWAQLVPPARMEALDILALEAAAVLDEITRADTPTSVDDVDFQFSDDLWAHILYDLALAARGESMEMDRMIAALVPIYFARVASLVIEAREMTTQQAESLVERQARAYEQAKPDFVERWRAGVGLRRPKARKSGKSGTASGSGKSGTASGSGKSGTASGSARSGSPRSGSTAASSRTKA
jgi:hypothetical protein